MKKYFTKLLPDLQKGMILKGDRCLSQDGMILIDDVKDLYTSSNGDLYELHELTRLKLFLCSRDIQLGDKVSAMDDSAKDCPVLEVKDNGDIVIDMNDMKGLIVVDEEENGEGESSIHEWFKVVGEISPDALSYVKEGQEFDEGEWRKRWYNPNFGFTPHNWHESDEYTNLGEAEREGKLRVLVQIKGPCGHFH